MLTESHIKAGVLFTSGVRQKQRLITQVSASKNCCFDTALLRHMLSSWLGQRGIFIILVRLYGSLRLPKTGGPFETHANNVVGRIMWKRGDG